MKKVILFVSILIVLTSGIYAQTTKNDEVIAIVKQAVAAQESYDAATLEKIYASDYIEISPKGEID